MEAGIMMHSDFHHLAPAQFQFPHQLDTDGAAGGGQVDLVQQGAANQPVIAIDIADANAEHQARAKVVNSPDPDAVPRVMTLQLVAVHEARGGRYQLEQAGKLADVILSVAIGVEDKFLLSRREPAAQRAAITAVVRMGDHAQPRAELAAKLIQHFAGAIMTAVVDHDDFVIGYVRFERGERLADQPRQRESVVIRREEDAQRWEFAGLQGYTIFSPMRTRDWPTGRSWPAPSQAASRASGA